MPDENPVDTFIARWRGVTASELATAQSFVMELCDLLAVGKPHHGDDYMFERPVTFAHGDGSTSAAGSTATSAATSSWRPRRYGPAPTHKALTMR